MKIAIAGYGLEGEQNYIYWNSPGNQVTILDEKETPSMPIPHDAVCVLGSSAYDDLSEFDIVIRTAGLPPRKLPSAKKVWSATNEFFEKCPAPIIGVTGTKGKGTTSSLIASILEAAGETVHLLGNIGKPALAELPSIDPGDIVVFELSSFQLWDVQRSPHVAVVLGIEPDHLDVHDDMDDYVAAKANIARFQTSTDSIVFNKNNTISVSIANDANAKKIEYPFDIDEMIASIRIPGPHNVENASAAIAAVSEYVTDTEVIKRGLEAFTGLPHRIKFVREVKGVKYYDDSYSSAPAASIAALTSFNDPKIIILGGYDKHADFSDLARYISQDQQVKKIVLIGQTRKRIAEELESAGVDMNRFEILETTDFSEIVGRVADLSASGDIVLLSPACASFGMFKNFTDRGEQFTALVNQL